MAGIGFAYPRFFVVARVNLVFRRCRLVAVKPVGRLISIAASMRPLLLCACHPKLLCACMWYYGVPPHNAAFMEQLLIYINDTFFLN